MKIRREAPRAVNTAVFSRNHGKYLKDAEALCKQSPGTMVTFRAESRWVSAADALSELKSIPIYFAVVGGPAEVEYTATLCTIKVDPSRSDPKTQEMLRHSLPGREHEGLWETDRKKGRVQTLYVIRDCRRLGRPFPIRRLTKVRGGRLNSGYRYSYSLVHRVALS
jgi:hypothetical protein